MAAVDSSWLRQWREREGLSQEQMADRLGLSRNRWSEIEGGEAPSLGLALSIERETGIPPRDFFRTDQLGRKHRPKGES